MNDQERRKELAHFLRTRRERLSPEAVGLPGGSRRRTPGLRREELAVVAGIGVTWYTGLEQGREITVSPQVLESLAKV
ncbi:MAG TPA: helix-turn-helix transcriptional regulator, partial [Ktedonobacteraceae bacterium]|nr:helix-turn-helix transcriptional regulator [Ktedonobacteraceae bacterium]